MVKGEDGHVYQARLKGKFKIKEITSTNPIAVGDEVVFEMEDEAENRTIITELTPRRNYVNRISPANRRQHHIIASNLDQSLLIATIKDPRTSVGFIDRFLVTCEAFHIPAIVVFNKSDLHEAYETALYEDRKAMYEKVGYKVLLTSVEEKEGEKIRKQAAAICTKWSVQPFQPAWINGFVLQPRPQLKAFAANQHR